MPDISMCKGINCKIREDCYRYTASPSEYHQAYIISEAKHNGTQDKDCDMFWTNEVYEKEKINEKDNNAFGG